jgi:hypothetical protein
MGTKSSYDKSINVRSFLNIFALLRTGKSFIFMKGRSTIPKLLLYEHSIFVNKILYDKDIIAFSYNYFL